MGVLIILRVALKALARNKMRTGLTMLGMIIGVAAVITMVALGNGAQQQIEDQVKSAGTNLITIRAGNYRRGGISHGMGAAPTLKAADIEAIREQVPGAVYLAASVNTRDQVVAGRQNWSAQIEGTDVEFPMIRLWDLEFGAFFTSTHVRSAAKVAVLGFDRAGQPLWRERRPRWPARAYSEPIISSDRRHAIQGLRTVRAGPG